MITATDLVTNNYWKPVDNDSYQLVCVTIVPRPFKSVIVMHEYCITCIQLQLYVFHTHTMCGSVFVCMCVNHSSRPSPHAALPARNL